MLRAGELLGGWLRAFSVLAEDPSSVPRTHIGLTTTCNSSSNTSLASATCSHMNISPQTHTHIHNLKNDKSSLKDQKITLVVMAHAFNLALGRQRQEDVCEFEASLIYRASSRTSRATQRDLVSKQQQTIQVGVKPFLRSRPLLFLEKVGTGMMAQRICVWALPNHVTLIKSLHTSEA